jgi:cleavage and polyadenylation specificity factor subunit 3
VTSATEALRKRVEAVLDMAVSTVSSLTESFQTGTSMLQEDTGAGKDIDRQDEPPHIPEPGGGFGDPGSEETKSLPQTEGLQSAEVSKAEA